MFNIELSAPPPATEPVMVIRLFVLFHNSCAELDITLVPVNIGIQFGDYITTYNILRPQIVKSSNPGLFIKEISSDRTEIRLSSNNIPYGSTVYIADGQKVKKNDVVCKWDPFNGVIVSEFAGTIHFENIERGINYLVEIDEQTGFQEKVIIESKNKSSKCSGLVCSKPKHIRAGTSSA